MALTKAAEKYLADWLKPASPQQDDIALMYLARTNFVGLVISLPILFIPYRADAVSLGIAAVILLPQLVVLSLSQYLLVGGKKRSGITLNFQEKLVAHLMATLMYADLFILVNQLVRR